MTARLMREGLSHPYPGFKDDEFFAMIDATGGWPVGYAYAGFEHTDERKAGFTNSHYNNGWWTVLVSADDYYLWKLSDEALQKIADAVISSIRIPKIDVRSLWIEGYRKRFQPRAYRKLCESMK